MSIIKIELAPGVEMVFVYVPASKFLMGSDPQKDPRARRNEQPQRWVMLDDYWIGQFPVTNVQFETFVNATGHRTEAETRGSSFISWRTLDLEIAKVDWQHPRGADRVAKALEPVVHVSWADAVAFCEWVSGLGQGSVRLPSEAEWEKAARGEDGRLFPWGNEDPTPQRCNYDCVATMDLSTVTTDVGSYSPAGDSPYGCADMAGGVWEWCNDWYAEDYYCHAPEWNPVGPPSGEYRVIRGGYWGTDRDMEIRSAYRDQAIPTATWEGLGFRCVWLPS